MARKSIDVLLESLAIVDEDDILRVKDGEWLWRGMKLSAEQVAALKQEASQFAKSALWRVLRSEIRYQAIKKLIEEGKTELDIRVAQVSGFLTEVVDKKLSQISR